MYVESLDNFRFVAERRFVCHWPPMGVVAGNGRKGGDATVGFLPSISKSYDPV